MFQNILVPLDNSESCRTVFEAALTLAKQPGSHLMLLHVLSTDEPIDLNSPSVFSEYYPTVCEELIERYQAERNALEEQILSWLRSLASEATELGATVDFTQMSGNPARLICDLAKDWNADLIVMGRRRRSRIGEMVLGSVSNYVFHHAPCSVLVTQMQEVKSGIFPKQETIGI